MKKTDTQHDNAPDIAPTQAVQGEAVSDLPIDIGGEAAAESVTDDAVNAPDSAPAEPSAQQPKSWAAEAKEVPAKSFLARLIPESKKGKIVFANAVAQVASMTVAPLAVLLLEHVSEKHIGQANRYVGKILGKHMDRIKPALGDTWKAMLTKETAARWSQESNENCGQFLANTLSNVGITGVLNVGVTMATRLMLDKALDINAGGKAVFQSQIMDTTVAVGSMIALPAILPEQTREARENMRAWLETKEGFVKRAGPKGPAQYALNTVNFAIPDLLGFATGTWLMTYKAEKEAAEAEKRDAQKSEAAPAILAR